MDITKTHNPSEVHQASSSLIPTRKMGNTYSQSSSAPCPHCLAGQCPFGYSALVKELGYYKVVTLFLQQAYSAALTELDAAHELIASLEEQVATLEERVATLEERHAAKDKQASAQEKKIDSLNEQVKTLEQSNAEYAEKLEDKESDIQDLKRRVNMTSENSSLPPSHEGINRKNRSLREKSGRTPGGQEGHKGTNLGFCNSPDNIVGVMPDGCRGCPHYMECLRSARIKERRQVYDLIMNIFVTEYRVLDPLCPVGEARSLGQFPEGVTARVQYGPQLQALVAGLYTYGSMSAERIHTFIGGMFDIPLSTGTVYNMTLRLAKKVEPVVDEIRSIVHEAPLIHCDETGVHVNKKLCWVHTASTASHTYLYLDEKRGKEAMESKRGVLADYQGTVIHDCLASYFHFGSRHGLCCVHLLRELKGIQENYPKQTWAPRMKEWMMKAKKTADDAVEEGKDKIDEATLQDFTQEYDKILELGFEENPPPKNKPGKPGRKAQGKARALLNRLSTYKDAVCLFLNDLSVPFDNNEAERSFRMVKVREKVGGGFRSQEGAECFVNIMSFLGTARKHGIPIMEALQCAIRTGQFPAPLSISTA